MVEHPHDSEGSMQHVVSALLRAGIILAGGVGLVGLVGYLLSHGHDVVSFHTFRGEASQDRVVGQILSGAASFKFRSIMQLGVLLLIATPVARVAVSLLGFIKEKDRTYVVITLIVLLALLGSLIGGGDLHG
ncbi:MAG: hypothetical protein BGO01_00015 [Armatimonadetes bacterium 55-13]|nr:DUF1634 domain-containing protein [Armatimonadota bacterium]OJU63086.1 MAG: hypothetical protein BGO01_00015 [Armatimonadetes bacterium 55-13]